MGENKRKERRWETRGGYPSSSKPVSDLKPPPTGPAPGANPKSKPNPKPSTDRPS